MPTNGTKAPKQLVSWVTPADALTERQKQVLVLVGLASMSSAFINTLFTQTVAFAAEEFGTSTTAQGIGAAIVRLGILISLPIVALADRRGRRPMVLAVSWIAPLVCALGAVAPSFEFLVATQTIGRPLGLTLDILVAVIAAEEMPRNSRAYATGLLAVLSGIGAGVAVASLPFADVGVRGWRAVYVMSLLWLLVAAALTRLLPESRRFEEHAARAATEPGAATRIRQRLGAHLAHICTVVFLSNLFVATASIFQNRYLREDRGYSALMVALFTVATSSPASLGLIVGGRVADERGRRAIGATMVPVGAVLLALSFSTSGAMMWSVAIAAALAFGVSYPALAVYRGELFPTSVRGLAGGLIMTSSLVGGSIGLVGAGWVLDNGISYGSVILALVAGPVIASCIVWFRYPETAHMSLEEINREDGPVERTPR